MHEIIPMLDSQLTEIFCIFLFFQKMHKTSYIYVYSFNLNYTTFPHKFGKQYKFTLDKNWSNRHEA